MISGWQYDGNLVFRGDIRGVKNHKREDVHSSLEKRHSFGGSKEGESFYNCPFWKTKRFQVSFPNLCPIFLVPNAPDTNMYLRS